MAKNDRAESEQDLRLDVSEEDLVAALPTLKVVQRRRFKQLLMAVQTVPRPPYFSVSARSAKASGQNYFGQNKRNDFLMELSNGLGLRKILFFP